MATVIFLDGVLEDGVNRSPTIPPNTRQAVAFPQRDTVQLVVRLTNPAGVPLPSEGTLRLTVKKTPLESPALYAASAIWDLASGPGVAVFNIPSTAFSEVLFGRYTYDVVLVGISGTRSTVIATSPLTLLAAVSAIP